MLYVPLQLKKLLKTLILFKQSKSYTLRGKTAGKHEWARKANQTIRFIFSHWIIFSQNIIRFRLIIVINACEV